jgi:poly(3-hydroxyalkanoate) synthetase
LISWNQHYRRSTLDLVVLTFGEGQFSFIVAMLKYPRYFSEPRSLDEITQFFAIEMWLYDSRPIIGDVYREIVDQVYRNNLFIKNKMKVGSDIINLEYYNTTS